MHNSAQPMIKTIALIGLCLVVSGASHAWGGYGHRVTGYIAESLLTPAARNQTAALLQNATLADAAVYMDLQRKQLDERWPESDRWHYDNRPVCEGQATNYCKQENCATAQIERFRRILADSNAAGEDRALALRLLVHMLADIHQPVHMADNGDRGANDVYIRLHPQDEPLRLHEALDSEFLRPLTGKQSARRYANALTTQYRNRFKDWRRGDVARWADESHQLAAKEVYGRLPGFACNLRTREVIELPAEFSERARDYLPQQLAKAGVRIAAVLNRTLR